MQKDFYEWNNVGTWRSHPQVKSSTQPTPLGSLATKWSGLLLLLLLSSSSFFFSAPLAHADVTNGLVGWWTFDGKDTNWTTGTTLDKTGNGNNGSLINMSTTTSPSLGKIGQGLFFPNNSTLARVNIGTGLNSIALANSYTVSFWVYEKIKVNASTFFSNYNGFGDPAVSIIDDSFNLKFVSDGTGSITGTTLTPNKWHHIVGTRDSATGVIKLYEDGALNQSGTGTTGTTNFNLNGNLNIGDNNAGSNAAGSIVDDVRVYNRALSAAEVKKLYTQNTSKFAASPTATSGTGLNSGLIGYWTFDGKDTNWTTGTTLDKSGNGNNGSLISMSTTTGPSSGKIGQALNFNGSSGYVDIANSASVANNLSNFSVSLWFKATKALNQNGMLVTKYSDGQSYLTGTGWSIDVSSNGYIYCQIETDGSNYTGVTTNPIDYRDGKWHHVLCVIQNGNTVTMYVDGHTTNSPGGSGTITGYSTATTIRIGNDHINNSSELFRGSIDDVRIYNRALSFAEMRKLYTQNVSKFSVSPTATSGTGLNSGLVGNWTFDGKDMNWTTGTVKDVSGNGNDGRIISMSTTTSPTTGKIGQALKFNGATSYIDAGNNPSIQLTHTGTVSTWVKFADSNQYAVIVGNGNWDTDRNGFLLARGYYGTELSFQLSGASSYIATWTGGGYNDNKWHLVTATFDGSYMAIYVDGNVVPGSIAAQTLDAVSGVYDLVIGKNPAGNDYYESSSIDDVRIYNRALSATEVKQLYNQSSSIRR